MIWEALRQIKLRSWDALQRRRISGWLAIGPWSDLAIGHWQAR